MWNHFVCLMVVTVSFAVSAGAQDLASCKQTDEILTELRELRALVDKLVSAQSQTQSASGTAQPQISTALTQIAVGNNPFLGSKDASLTIVEFTDFQCPYCNQFFVQTFPQLKENYIDSGKVRFYSVDFPLNIHENALQAAQAGRCAADEEKFWLMHDPVCSETQTT